MLILMLKLQFETVNKNEARKTRNTGERSLEILSKIRFLFRSKMALKTDYLVKYLTF